MAKPDFPALVQNLARGRQAPHARTRQDINRRRRPVRSRNFADHGICYNIESRPTSLCRFLNISEKSPNLADSKQVNTGSFQPSQYQFGPFALNATHRSSISRNWRPWRASPVERRYFPADYRMMPLFSNLISGRLLRWWGSRRLARRGAHGARVCVCGTVW